MDGRRRTMRSDDLVILFMGHDDVDYCYLSPETNSIFQNKFGTFPHSKFVGKEYGSRIESMEGGWLYALYPTPELWSSCVKHRTQIVHQLDSAILCFELGLKTGSVVAEAGTGSGALTTYFSRACGPEGHVHTFEFHEKRAEAAKNEFERNGLNNVTTRHRDVCCQEGFADLPEASVDAIFLDLPEPWLALPYVWRIAKPGAILASYSPCIEQAQRTNKILLSGEAERDVQHVKTIEARQRDFVVTNLELESFPSHDRAKPYATAKPVTTMRGHTAFLTFATLY